MVKVAFLLDPKNLWIKPHLDSYLPNRSDVELGVFDDPSEAHSFDVVFVLGYTKILPRKFLEQNELTLVVHASDLPEGKGFAPVQWQILGGQDEIVVSLIIMDEAVDSGDIIDQTHINFEGGELYEEIRLLQSEATFRVIDKFLSNYPNYERKPQVGNESFFRRRTPADSELDVDKSIRDNFNLLRIANNDEWPSFFYLNGTRYILKIYKDDD